jgi:hypothetical protein
VTSPDNDPEKFAAVFAVVAVVAVIAFEAFVALSTVPAILLPETELICESFIQPAHESDKESAVAAVTARTA